MKNYKILRFLAITILLFPVVSAFLGNTFPITTNSHQEFTLKITKGSDLIKNKTGEIENYYVPQNKIYVNTSDYRITPQEGFLRSNDYKLVYIITDKASNTYKKTFNFTYTSYPPELTNIPRYYINGVITGTIKNGNKIKITITRLDKESNIVSSKEISTENNFTSKFTLKDGLYLVTIKGENPNSYTKIKRIMFVDHTSPKVSIGVENGEILNNYIVLTPKISDIYSILKPRTVKITLKKQDSTIYQGNLSEGFFLAKKLTTGDYSLYIETKDKAGNSYSKTINFKVKDNISLPIIYEDNKILPKYIKTNNKTITITISPTPSSITFDGANLATSNKLTLSLKEGENKLTLTSSDGGKIIYVITRTASDYNIRLCNLTKINSESIIENNTILTRQRDFLICGDSNTTTYINNVKVTNQGPFYRYIYLNKGKNQIEIETSSGYKKNITINYIPEFTEIISTNLKSLTSNPKLSFKLNLTEIGTPLFIYLNGKLKTITIPKTKEIGLEIGALQPGLNIVEIKTLTRELLFKPVIYDNTQPEIKLTSPNIIPSKGVVFHINTNYGINLDKTKLTITNDYGATITIEGDKIKLIGDYLIFNSDSLSPGSYNYKLTLETLSRKKISKTGTFQVRNIFITKITNLNEKEEIPFYSGLIFLKSNNLEIEFNKDIIVRNIKIDNITVLNYKLLGNKIEIEIPENLTNSKGQLELTVGDRNLKEYKYSFIYYSKKYKPKLRINYIPDYLSISGPIVTGQINSEICNWSSVTINNDNTPQKFGNIFIAKISPISPLYIKACNLYLDECEKKEINTIFSDNSDLNIQLKNKKEDIECKISNIDKNIGNLVTLEDINRVSYNWPLSFITNITPPITLTEPSLLNVKIKENSGKEYEKKIFMYDPDKSYLLEELKNGILYLDFADPFTNITFYENNNILSYGIDSNKKFYSLGLNNNGNYTISTPEFNSNIEFTGATCNNKLPKPTIETEGEDVKISAKDVEAVSIDNINLPKVMHNEIETMIKLTSGIHRLTLFRKGDCGQTIESYLIYIKPTISTKLEFLDNNNESIVLRSNIPIENVKSNGEAQPLHLINNKDDEFTYKTVTPNTGKIEIDTPVGNIEKKIDNRTITTTNLSLILSSLNNNNMFRLNGIYVTNLKNLIINGKINKNALVKVYINNREITGMVSEGNFSINVNLSDLITDRDSMKLNVQLKAETPFQETKSNTLTAYFKRILSAIVSVIIK